MGSENYTLGRGELHFDKFAPGTFNKTGERYREFADALKTGNAEAAQEAFKRTAAWYYSADPKNRDKITPRQRNYLRLIQQSLKG